MWINVRDAPYDAAGNGTIDDTGAIQQALDDGAFGDQADENAVYFPPGIYRITNTLEVTRNRDCA